MNHYKRLNVVVPSHSNLINFYLWCDFFNFHQLFSDTCSLFVIDNFSKWYKPTRVLCVSTNTPSNWSWPHITRYFQTKIQNIGILIILFSVFQHALKSQYLLARKSHMNGKQRMVARKLLNENVSLMWRRHILSKKFVKMNLFKNLFDHFAVCGCGLRVLQAAKSLGHAQANLAHWGFKHYILITDCCHRKLPLLCKFYSLN